MPDYRTSVSASKDSEAVTPDGGPPPPPRRKRRRPSPWVVVAILTVFVTLIGVTTWLGRGFGERVPPGVSVADVDIGGLTTAAARKKIARFAARAVTPGVTLVGQDPPSFRMHLSHGDLGATIDIAATVASARHSGGIIERIGARLGLREPQSVRIRFRLDEKAVRRVVAATGKRLDRQPRAAALRHSGGRIRVIGSRAGGAVEREVLADRLGALPRVLVVPVRAVRPPVDDAAARRARDLAQDVIATKRRIVRGERQAVLDVATLRRALRFRSQPPAIRVHLEPDALRRHLGRSFADLERRPRDAAFRVRGRRVTIVPSRPGRRLDVERLSRDIVQRPASRVYSLRTATVLPALDDRRARRMRIREPVAEFTTRYACCPPRVTNIRRAARILNGTIIPVGATFSLNQALGQRTAARGFVAAPMIESGRLRDSVGGGVSQIATTMYNAAFFAGLELVEHTPHQFYISRYPVGREATVSWGGPELKVRNNWPAAVLVWARAGKTAVTIRLYSARLGRRVVTTTGPRTNFRPARTRVVTNAALAPGARVVAQSGGTSGFSVNYSRKVFRGAKLRRAERFHVDYDPEDTIIEVGPR